MLVRIRAQAIPVELEKETKINETKKSMSYDLIKIS